MPALHSAPPANLADALRLRAAQTPAALAYRFLTAGESEGVELSYAGLDLRARAIAAELMAGGLRGRRALLLYPPGLEYVSAFFGCLYAGVSAVPAYPPMSPQMIPRLVHILRDAKPSAVLATALVRDLTQGAGEAAAALLDTRWIATDELADDRGANFEPVDVAPSDVAFVQYTSGSTANPRGVLLDHAALRHNVGAIAAHLASREADVGVSWLPPYHDMGLIGAILTPLFAGFPVTLMSPIDFLGRPLRWLEALSRYGASVSVGPNFAFDLCVRRAEQAPEALEQANLDLSRWRVALNGAEPVRPDTLERFTQTFGRYGFRPDTFCPCYGLAESTLMVTRHLQREPVRVVNYLKDALGGGRAVAVSHNGSGTVRLVSCGPAIDGQRVQIVDASSHAAQAEDHIGEIWVNGPSVASGYHARPEDSEESFAARIDGATKDPDLRWLRTGDLGFLSEGELFVTGRIKDVIIVRGRNHYPHDIEGSAESAHAALRRGRGAAFGIQVAGEERVGLVYELEVPIAEDAILEAVAGAIREAVARDHGLHLHTIALLNRGDAPTTSSGKIRRGACRDELLGGELQTRWVSTANAGGAESSVEEDEVDALTAAIRGQLAELLGVAPREIDEDIPLVRLGLDSVMGVELSDFIARDLGRQVDLHRLPEETTLRGLGRAVRRGASALPEAPREDPDDVGGLLREARDPAPIGNLFEHARNFDLPDRLRAAGKMPYFRAIDRNDGVHCEIEGRRVLMFGSNNYLGLTADPRVRRAAADAALELGPSLTGSRLLNGSTTLHRELEEQLADFLGREDALVFTTGYQANVGLISSLVREGTTLYADQQDHASIFDGAFIGRCRIETFRHDDAADLDRRLTARRDDAHATVVIEGVYSMRGDVASLPAFVEVCSRHGVPLIVDDAHGLGMLGDAGRGVEEHYGLVGSSDLLSGTFSKSLASVGGWVAGERRVLDWIRFNGRSMLFSAASSPPALAAAAKALELLRAEPWRVSALRENAALWRRGVMEIGLRSIESPSAVVPLLIGDDALCVEVAEALLEAGLYTNAVVAPAVAPGAAMIRTSVLATHEPEHLERALGILGDVAERFGLSS